jgi:hypothetical protein
MNKNFYYMLTFVLIVIAGLSIGQGGVWDLLGMIAAYFSGICVTVVFPIPKEWVKNDE